MSEDPEIAKALTTRTPDAAIDVLEQIKVVPEAVDLELALFILPRVRARLAHLMEIKGIAEMKIKDSLKDREGRQRVHGGSTFGLKDGEWIMGQTDAMSLLRYLTTYVGDDYTQEMLDKGIRLQAVEAACPTCGPLRVACPKCGQPIRQLVVDHRGLNAIEKVARADIKKRLDGVSPETMRRRAEPSLVVKPTRVDSQRTSEE
jgi:hypothetical protein